MAVSLKKPNTPIREITPVHLIDEEETIVKSVHSEPASKPETLKIVVASKQHSPAIVEPVPDAKIIERGISPSYSQLVQDNRQERLAEIFRHPTEQEWSPFEKIKEQLIPIVKKSHKCETGCFIAIAIALLSVPIAIAMMLLSQWLFMGIGFGLFVLACIAIYLSVRISPYDIDGAPSWNQSLHFADMICQIKSAQNLFICTSGADTQATFRKLKSLKDIDYRIFRPKHCTDYEAYKAITTDRHSVFMIYDEEYAQVICVDPLLFK